ncbi:G2/mitotic-specific cyclin-B3-like [Babylonia areolata]|uniref:G2/mitotic-specific cyclin-B3-like n=1 Tax=Babylonia areolata TaxID=304850 RepID=UPI003FCFF85C
MKSTRETRKTREDQAGVVQGKKMVKGDDVARLPRPAFGDLTNAVQKNVANGKKDAGGKKVRQPVEAKVKAPAPKTRTSVAAAAQNQRKTRKPTTTAAAAAPTKAVGSQVAAKPVAEKKKEVKKAIVVEEEPEVEVKPAQEPVVTSSKQSAVGGSHDLSDMVVSDLELSVDEGSHSRMSLDQSALDCSTAGQHELPEVPVHLGVEDVDRDDQDDLHQVALYAHDIFIYYKEREEQFRLSPYLARHPQVTQRMRAVLVDWLVEVQENFELNHETLYLAVKLVDTYMASVQDIQRDNVQLLGAVSLFLSSKYDERMPPAIDDFIYICDHAYNRDQFMAMERELFRTVGFDLGRPISYRFLRRYSRCGRSETKTLYLARYILELSQMEYKFVFQRESMMAASVLYIARMMRRETGWTPTLEFYTGYTLKEMKPLILEINNQFRNRRHPDLSTIHDKYRHHLFHSVGEIPPVSNEDLFPAQSKESSKPAPRS